MAPIAKFSLVALDCVDPSEMARFYGAITGWGVDPESDDDWIQLASHSGATIAFQRSPGHVPPDWPDGTSQQAHLDFDVDDLDDGEARVLDMGAHKAEFQPHPDSFRVFLDPAGHPFCLVRASSST